MTNKTDLTNYSTKELTLQVFNSEYLYLLITDTWNLINTINDMFAYRNDQFDDLIESINEYNHEYYLDNIQ
jgi:hypothetical protein